MAEIELRQINKTFDKKVNAVKDITFKADDGEFLTLLGPSGCGKSTILRLLAGLEMPDSGEIIIDSKKVNDIPPADRDVAMVFQSYALYPHMTVFDNIAVNLRLRKVKKEEFTRRVLKTSKTLGISDLLDRRPRALSGGQRQRVALARAIIRNPKVFLLDEPLSNLDAALREKTRGELKLLFSQLGATVIYVTHDQIEAMTMSHRIVVLKDGVIQQIGTPHEIYNVPINTFVATFIGSPKMNLIHGKTDDDNIVFTLNKIPLFVLPGKDRLRKHIGNDVIVGIRPEDITITSRSHDETHNAQIVLCELTGQQTMVTLHIDGLELKVIAPSSFDASEKLVGIKIDPLHIHLFDPLSGQKIY
ncbi:MAG: ABC transporter ATP-binding protein [Nitrospinota bacterium]